MKGKQKALGLFSITMLSIVAIFNPRTLPLMAEYGFSSVIYYLIAAVLYFIPFSLVCAELATGWPKKGGLYVWSREAFGYRLGFLTIWLEWISNVIGWPTSLAIIAATLAYVISPQLADNRIYAICIMLLLFWLFSLINLLGIKIASWVSNIGLILGTLIPTALIIILGFMWFFSPATNHIQLSWHTLLPTMKLGNATFFIGVMLGLAGMQIAAFHANDVENPQKNFPKAIALATVIILFFSIFGSLAIATVLPKANINLIAGNIQVIQVFLLRFHLHWLTSLIAIAMAIGACAMLNAWIGGPSKGLLVAAEDGDIPYLFTHKNKHGAPVTIIIAQAIIVSLLALVFLFAPTLANSFWLVTDLSAIITLLMCIIIFASLIRLRYIAPDQPRAYKIPGGKFGAWLISGTGIAICSIGIIVGFLPPAQLHAIHLDFYESFLIIGTCLFICPAFFIQRKHSKV